MECCSECGVALSGVEDRAMEMCDDCASDVVAGECRRDENDAIADAISEFDSIVFPNCGSGMPAGYDSWKLDNGRA